ncbi:MAG: sigma-70 family RNA polymerase sigma factor [Actinomycetota bacterium]|nr:sigma-70 family RNA polymerase sigma factor [Actinomycetota bacterium]
MTTISPPRLPAAAPVLLPAARLAELDNSELLAIAQSPPRAGERAAAARELLVLRHRNLVLSCVWRFRTRSGPADDLIQVGYVGLMKAINNYDPAAGTSLAAYAQPTIIGELMRHFRDDRWPVHIRRSAQQLARQVRVATAAMTQELGRPPADAELIGNLGVDQASLRDARLAEVASHPCSLDAPIGGGAGITALTDLLGEDDPQIEHMLSMQAVAAHWGGLPARERAILTMRFQGNLTQSEIGARIGLSQMQVSRLLSHALDYLRPYLIG